MTAPRMIIPELDSVEPHTLFLEPQRDLVGDPQEKIPPESDADFDARLKFWRPLQAVKVKIRYADDAEVLELGHMLKRVTEDDIQRVNALKEDTNKEDSPILFRAGYQTEEGMRGFRDACKTLCASLLRGFEGFDIKRKGEKIAVERVTDPDELVNIVLRMRWSLAMVRRLLAVQTPDPESLLH